MGYSSSPCYTPYDMRDEDFEEIRAALAPEREPTARLGALQVLAVALDDDDRLPPLFATLLRSRNPEIAAHAGAIVYDAAALRSRLERDLERAWSFAPPEYRAWLLGCLSARGVVELAQRYAETPDTALKLALIARLGDVDAASATLDAALFLTHDRAALVRAGAAELLPGLCGLPDGPAAVGAALGRLASDDEASVRRAAVHALENALDPEGARVLLAPLVSDADLDVRGAASAAMRRIQGILNRRAVEPLIRRQRELIAAGDYNGAMAAAAQVFMRVVDHPECQFQMARAAAGGGDMRRAARLLAHAIAAGFRERETIINDSLLQPLKATEAWEELMELLDDGTSG